MLVDDTLSGTPMGCIVVVLEELPLLQLNLGE